MAAREIPVYLFTGFLDGGKSTFVQSTLEDRRFNSGEKTLLIRCEEGEVEYDFSAFSGDNVFLRAMEEEEEFNEAAMQAAAYSSPRASRRSSIPAAQATPLPRR